MGSETEFHAQKTKLHEFDPVVNNEFSTVGLYQLVPQKKVLKLQTKSEVDTEKATTEKHNKIQADAELAQAKVEKRKPAKI